MDRRSFMAASVAATAVPTAAFASTVSAADHIAADAKPSNKAKFNLKYAPTLGAFREHAGKEIADNIQFIADQGFRAIFDNGFMKRPVSDQKLIAKELEKRDMDFGPFVLYADFKTKSFVLKDKEVKDMLVKKMKEGVETAKRSGAKWALVVPGRYDEKLHMDYQTANVIDNLRYCMDVVEESGLVIVLEPLNAHENHPGLYLTGMPQSYMVCRGVNHPCCKIVDDFYHQQITEGRLIRNFDMCWDEIAAIHIGDTPGRKEPGTGEINYKNVFKHVYDKGFDGVLCMEHGKSIKGIEGEKALIEAYRIVDNF